MTKAVLGVSGAVAVVLAAASLSAQTRKSGRQQVATEQRAESRRRAAETPGSDASIAARLHRFHRTQIDAAQIAQDQGRSEEVQRFAQSLVENYQINDDKLVQWVAQNGLADEVLKQGSTEGGTADAELSQTLQTTPAERFDGVFLANTLRLHDKAYQLCTRGSDEVTNFDLRALLQNTMPMLQKNRATAQRLLDIAEASEPVARQPSAPGTPAAAATPSTKGNGIGNGNGHGHGNSNGNGHNNGNGNGSRMAVAPPSPTAPPPPPELAESSPSPAPTSQPGVRSEGLADPNAIRTRIMRDPSIADDDVEVTVMQGAVILTGRVDSQTERNLAAEIARRYVGPTLFVDNRLLVGPPSVPAATP